MEGGDSHGSRTVRNPVTNGRTGPAGTTGWRGKEPSAQDCPGADSAQGRCGLGRIVEALDISPGTVCRIKRRYVEGGLQRALEEEPRPGRAVKLDARGEAHLIALACSEAPQGHDHWTMRLLAGKVVELGLAPSMSHEGVRKRLKKTLSSRGKRRSGVFLR